MTELSHPFYKFAPGQCTCDLGDPVAGSRRVNVRKMSGRESVLDPADGIRENQYVYTQVNLLDGPALALAGLVVTSTPTSIVVQWTHSSLKEADRIDRVVREYLNHRKRQAPPPPGPPATAVLAVAAPIARAAAAPARSGTAPTSGGKMDVGATIRRKAKLVKSSELASRVDTVQVLNIGTIKSLIKDAVDETVTLLGPILGEAEKKQLLEESEASFREKFEVFRAEKAGLEEKSQALQGQLEKAQALLVEEKSRVVTANQFTVSDVGMAELEQRLGRMFDRAMKTGKVGPDLEAEMRTVVTRLLDDERDKIRERAQEAQSDRICLLEKKVQRLAVSLETTEVERDEAMRRAQALEASGGMPLRSVMTAGLVDGDPSKEKKLGLLKEIFKFNKEIRDQLAAQGRLPKHRTEAPDAGAQVTLPRARASQPEEEIANSLGIRKKTHTSKTREAFVDEDTEELPTDATPVLSAALSLDPDHEPWAPPAATGAEEKPDFRRLGN